jgi:DNA mismatch repair protein MutS
MMRQYAKAKAEHPDAIVMFRLGDFYEMFYDDAEIVSRQLELVLTSREAGKGNRVPMCGVPVHTVDAYTSRLLDAGYKVAICDQVEDAKQARGLVRRKVIRVLTPGTVVEESMLEECRNNFLVAICETVDAFGLAALDVSTGEFKATTLSGDDALETLQAELARLQPAECLLSAEFERNERWAEIKTCLPLHRTSCDAATFCFDAA